MYSCTYPFIGVEHTLVGLFMLIFVTFATLGKYKLDKQKKICTRRRGSNLRVTTLPRFMNIGQTGHFWRLFDAAPYHKNLNKYLFLNPFKNLSYRRTYGQLTYLWVNCSWTNTSEVPIFDSDLLSIFCDSCAFAFTFAFAKLSPFALTLKFGSTLLPNHLYIESCDIYTFYTNNFFTGKTLF